MRTLAQPALSSVDELVINWHVTEACNFRCRYCYAQWDKAPDPRELFHDEAASRQLLEQLAAYFSPDNCRNPLRDALAWSSLRLNLAGGEPLLYGLRILWVARQAHSLGMRVSIITNGSLLTRDRIGELAPLLTVLGVSIDTADAAIARDIGRGSRNGSVLDLVELQQGLRFAREINPALHLKLNTVVSALNHREDMSALIGAIGPDRWKVLRMLPSVTDALAVTAEAFERFVDRHRCMGLPMCVEDNHDMSQSYIMIDPQGRFFQNAPTLKGYRYSRPILEVGVGSAFAQIEFEADGFVSRYVADGVGA
ncbi:MAG: viperin family antiviral radical SAM protein [Zoogloea sp.]|nr:viperin family antiviral radical SAM protein [Zoogloea sp.]